MISGVADAEPLYRLVTTVLDPAQAAASDLAALYHGRWEIEGALVALTTHLREAQVVLRRKLPLFAAFPPSGQDERLSAAPPCPATDDVDRCRCRYPDRKVNRIAASPPL